ncbi:DUF3105 domain-containing protein [Deinococcus yunweiensis]|uniref:DUF3105 domain-containing protein n=1 Tax=Deinococcus yunweiensis TaxID=367282 RepID=UPI00398E7CCD
MKQLVLLAVSAVLASCSNSSELGAVKSFTFEGGAHQAGRVAYEQSPPAGGPHNGAWQNCGVYDRALYDEYAVHSLEHGAVWITYKVGTPPEQIQALKALVGGRTYTLLSPHETQTAPVVLTAWNRQLELQAVNDKTVKAFLQAYEQGGEAPEIGASCSGAYQGTV